MRLSSTSIEKARKNLYRPARVVCSEGFGGFELHAFTLLHGADPLKAVRRFGLEPKAVRVLPGRLGDDPRPDVIEFDCRFKRSKARAKRKFRQSY